MNCLLRSIALSLLWLSVGLACKQAPQPADQQTEGKAKTVFNGPVAPTTNLNTCDDGTCCGRKGIYYKYHETLSGDTVILRGNIIKFSRLIPKGTTQAWATYAEVCTLTAAPVDKLIYEVFGKANNDDPIKCRIWGRVYTGDKFLSLNFEDPPRFFAVDRVEAIK